MSQKISPSTAVLLTIPPLLWAGNAIVGRLVSQLAPPVTLNLLRWALAFLILLPFAYSIFRPGSGLWMQRAGPSVAGFFSNLTPLFAAIMSAAFLGELPHLYHGLAFVLIVGGILLSARR